MPKQFRLLLFLYFSCLASSQTLTTNWRVGVLDGYQFFAVVPRTGTKSKPIDLRTRWSPDIFFRSQRQIEKQGHDYPSIRILTAAGESAKFVANLSGLEYREDGPLVIASAQDGAILRSLPISDSGAVAAFAPGDDRRVLVSWLGGQEGAHIALYDTATGQRLFDVPGASLPAFRFFFSQGTRVLLTRTDADTKPQYRFFDLQSEQWEQRLPLPTGNYTVLDLDGETALIELRSADIAISCWNWGRPGAAPILIHTAPYGGGSPPVEYFLSSHGHRVIAFSTAAPAATLYDSATGRVVARTNLSGRIRAFALHPDGDTAIFAVGQTIFAMNTIDGRLRWRAVKVVSRDNSLSLFWYRQQ